MRLLKKRSLTNHLINHTGLKVFLLNSLVLLVAFGPNLSLPICSLLKIPSQAVSVGVRVLIFTISILLFFSTRINLNKIKISIFLLIVFWLIYSSKLIYDVSFLQIPFGNGNRTAIDIYSFFFGNALLPCFALIINRKYLNISSLVKWQFVFLLIVNIITVSQVYLRYGFSVEIFAERNAIGFDDKGGKVVNLMNPILLSITGASLGILSLFMLFFSKEFRASKLISSFGLIIGIVTLLLGASRGPTLVFTICLLLVSSIYFYDGFISKTKVLRKISSFIFVILITVGLIPSIIRNIDTLKKNVEILRRLDRFFNKTISDDGDIRVKLVDGAMQQFMDHPILGYRYLEMTYNFYPHNIFVEVLMATGVVGGFFFYSVMLIILFKSGKYIVSRNFSSIGICLIGFIFLLAGLTSGCLFFSVNFWIYVVLILCLPSYRSNSLKFY